MLLKPPNDRLKRWTYEQISDKNDYKNRSIKTLISGMLLKHPNDRLKRWTYEKNLDGQIHLHSMHPNINFQEFV
jgi:hypothetical protein